MGYSSLSSSIHRAMPLAGLILAAALVSAVEADTPKASCDPFAKLSGDWKGGGTVMPTDGQPKEVSCSETYRVAGSNITQNQRCTGNDYEINTTLKLTCKAGKIKGSWTESTYDASGGATGTAKANLIHVILTGDKFSGRMSINVSDAGHSINILKLDEKSGAYRLATSLTLGR
jgi:hypothetical protein